MVPLMDLSRMKIVVVVVVVLHQSTSPHTRADTGLLDRADTTVLAATLTGNAAEADDCDDSSEENNSTSALCSVDVDGAEEPEALPLANGIGILADDPTEAGMAVFGDPLISVDGTRGGGVFDLKLGTADIHGTSNPYPYDPLAAVLNGLDDGRQERNLLRGVMGLRGSSLPRAPPGGLFGDAPTPAPLYETVGADVPIVVLKNDPTYKRIREETKHHQVISLEPVVSLLEETTKMPGNASKSDPTLGSYTILDSNTKAGAGTPGPQTNPYTVLNPAAKSDVIPSTISAAKSDASPGAHSITSVDIFSLLPDPARPGQASLLSIIKRAVKRRNL